MASGLAAAGDGAGTDNCHEKTKHNTQNHRKKGNQQRRLQAVGQIFPPVVLNEVQIKLIHKFLHVNTLHHFSFVFLYISQALSGCLIMSG